MFSNIWICCVIVLTGLDSDCQQILKLSSQPLTRQELGQLIILVRSKIFPIYIRIICFIQSSLLHVFTNHITSKRRRAGSLHIYLVDFSICISFMKYSSFFILLWSFNSLFHSELHSECSILTTMEKLVDRNYAESS